ncbi:MULTISPECIES: hypothetical protein [unclassified Streptomyces]|uniref:hypothetical protein n=1 Tax=unclassified Streptomyces TaxID=2593676 RepID=UPI00070C6A21|nr:MULTISPECIES: hypothetical protein [unclassified Streptomyces]KRD06259.1 hypothetical protein ASE41_32190 [Streptomyces sp. Root264]
MRIRATIVTAALLLAALTACSSSGDDAPAASDSGTPVAEPTISVPAEHEGDDLKAAVAVYTASYFAGDADTAYGMLSARCAKKITKTAYSEVVKKASADYGADHAVSDVQAEVSGKTGRAGYKVTGLPKFDQQAQPWVLEGDAWKYDAC